MNEDELYRSAFDSAVASERNISDLYARSAPDLYAILAERTQSASRGTTGHGFATPVNIDDLHRDVTTTDLGKRIFLRWSRALHQFACDPDADDVTARDRLVSALTGSESSAAVVAAILVSSFGASPAVAAVVAALLIKLIFQPAKLEVCETWSRWLAQS